MIRRHDLRQALRCVCDIRATLGEGPIWCADTQSVWFVDIKQRRIHCFDSECETTRSWEAPSQVGFIAPVDERVFVAGLKTGLHRFDSNDGTFSLLREVEPGLPNNRLNDGYVDAHGRLWFGSMDDDERTASGALYRLDRDGMIDELDNGVCITNGPCLSPDGGTLYYTDTVNRTIYAFDAHDDGSLSGKRVFARFDLSEGYPDGSIVDSEGCLWIGVWGGWRLQRLSPRGERIGQISLACANVTKAVFGGRDLKTLYIATARKGWSESQLAAQPQAGGLFAIEVDVAGLPSNHFVLPTPA